MSLDVIALMKYQKHVSDTCYMDVNGGMNVEY